MQNSVSPVRQVRSTWRLAVAAGMGLIVAGVVGLAWRPSYGLVCGWIVMSELYVITTWAHIGRMDADTTRAHAKREDPSKRTARLIVVVVSAASVGGVAVLQVAVSTPSTLESIVGAVLVVVSLLASWVSLHTIFVLKYAELHYSDPVGGVDFNQEEGPTYADFAYLAFTVGMTYQVSDTTLQSRAMRLAVLQQAFLSFLFVSVILATIVNLIASA